MEEKIINKFTPQEILQALIVNICDHCNLNCRGCDHFSPIAEERFIPAEEIGKDLARIREILDDNIRLISVMGGEPLLHPELVTILQQARNIFPTTEIRLRTNGTLLLKQDERFWECCRENNIEINVTKYPIAFAYDKAGEIALAHGVRYVYNGGGDEEKTMGHYPLNLNGDCNPTESFAHCFHANNDCNMLSNGRLYPCTVAPNIPIFNKKYGVKIPLTKEDGMDIYAISGKRELMERLSRPMPICRYCDVLHRTFDHKYGPSKGAITEWT